MRGHNRQIKSNVQIRTKTSRLLAVIVGERMDAAALFNPFCASAAVIAGLVAAAAVTSGLVAAAEGPTAPARRILIVRIMSIYRTQSLTQGGIQLFTSMHLFVTP